MEDVQLTRTIVFHKHCLYQLSGGIRGFISIIKVDSIIKFSLRPTLFVLFEKSNFLREYYLLSYLSFKNV